MQQVGSAVRNWGWVVQRSITPSLARHVKEGHQPIKT